MTATDQNLSELCELLIDSKLGYGDASRRADDVRLKRLLANIGESRIAMIASVANAMERSGWKVPHNGTFRGTLHRVWMAVRDIISNTDDVNMISECERGESYLVGKYDQCINLAGSTEEIRSMLVGQRADLMANLMEIRSVDLALTEA